MIDAIRSMFDNQYQAALCMMRSCIDDCPESKWNEPVANLAFCQAVFHTLFFVDCYLGQDSESMREQAFHRAHESFFRNYEELEDRKQELLYDRATTLAYLDHCRHKAREVVAAETESSLALRTGFDHLPFSRAELHVMNIRHIQHHTAQLSLRRRIDDSADIR
ncbi:MAG: DinB family protein [Planctomycetota bacterium]|jgi:hypothetical protein